MRDPTAPSSAPSGLSIPNTLSFLFAVVLTCSACNQHEPGSERFIKHEVPFSTSSWTGQANLYTTPDGKVVLTWLEKVERERYALRLAVRQAGIWSVPRTITEGNAFVIHWAELPSLVELPNGQWIMSWIEEAKEGKEYTEIKISKSNDEGVTWGPPIELRPDNKLAYRSSIFPLPWGEGNMAVIYLDGRDLSDGKGRLERRMKVRFTTFSTDGKRGLDAIVDNLACDCCRPALARTARGLVATYRHRDPKETRDIYIARYGDESWTRPVPVHDDGWILKGCPLNGPALSTSGDTVAVAWFTGAREMGRVFVAFSDNGGATFGLPILVSDQFTFGRVAIELVSDKAALVSWLDIGKQGGTLMARLVMKDGAMGKSFPVSQRGGASLSRIPHMARVGKELLFAWTDSGEPGSLRVASLTQEPK
jgi:hypothetical protein